MTEDYLARCKGCEHLVSPDGRPLSAVHNMMWMWNGVELGMCMNRFSSGSGMIHTEDSVACSGHEPWAPSENKSSEEE